MKYDCFDWLEFVHKLTNFSSKNAKPKGNTLGQWRAKGTLTMLTIPFTCYRLALHLYHEILNACFV